MLFGFAVAVGVISWQDLSKCHQLPWPPRIVAAGLVFAILDAVSVVNQQLANVLAIGFVLAMLVTNELKADACNHSQYAIAQPASYQLLSGGGTVGTIPANQVQSD
jgi:hypothetical protein